MHIPFRRRFLYRAVAGTAVATFAPSSMLSATEDSSTKGAESLEHQFYSAALSMKRLAESWGDQPYGAVLVFGGRIIGEGPSRVVKLADPSAHAEREAIRDAQRKLGRDSLAGSLLYSTARPCRVCEIAAARAGVARMIVGPELQDAGRPSA